MLHLGVITTSFPRFHGDHAGSFVWREVLELLAAGHTITVVAPRSDCPERPRPTPPAGLRVVEAPTPLGVFYGPGAPERLRSRSPGLYLRAALATFALQRSARRELSSCDAICAHWLLPSGLIAATIAAGRPFHITAHSAGAQMALRAPRVAQRALRLSLRRATAVSSSDPEVAVALSKLLARPVGWAAARANTAPLLELRPTQRDAGAPLTLGFLGRRVPVKGLDRLLEALTPMPDGVRLIVAGPGPALSPTSGVEDIGAVEGDAALRAFFSQIDVLAIPSRRVEGGRSEGLPCALLEAWAAGRPVLGSAVGAMSTLLDASERLPADASVALWRSRLLELRDDATCGAGSRARLHRLERRWDEQRERDRAALRIGSRC